MNECCKKTIERLEKEFDLRRINEAIIKQGLGIETPEKYCENCGHGIDSHGGDTPDDLNHCVDCIDNEYGFQIVDCNSFKPLRDFANIKVIQMELIKKIIEGRIKKTIAKLRGEIDNMLSNQRTVIKSAGIKPETPEKTIIFVQGQINALEKVEEILTASEKENNKFVRSSAKMDVEHTSENADGYHCPKHYYRVLANNGYCMDCGKFYWRKVKE